MSPPKRLRHCVLWALLAAALLAWGWFDVRRRGRIDPANPAVHKTDFTIYTEAGAAFHDGRDPYAVKNIRGWEYLYPPLFALLVAPLHRLPPQDQVFVWFLVSSVLGVAAIRECRRISLRCWDAGGAPQPPPAWVGPLALLAGLLPLLNALQRGQAGSLVLWSLLAGLALIGAARGPGMRICGGGLLALPIVVKLTPALPVAALLLVLGLSARRRSAIEAASGVAAGLLLGFVVVPGLLVGWEANLRHLGRWWTAVATNPNLAADTRLVLDSVRNQSLANALRLVFGPEQAWLGSLTVALNIGVAALLLAALVRSAQRGATGLDAAVVFGLAAVATLVLSPVSWGHHYVLLLPAAAFVPLYLLRIGSACAAKILAMLPAVLVILHYVFLETTGRLGLLGIGTLGWFVAAAALFVRGPRRLSTAAAGG